GTMTDDSIDLGPLVDHHCHGVVLDDLDRASFETLLNEAAAVSPLGTTFFDSMLGLAVRRWCAPVLGLEPKKSGEENLSPRRSHSLMARPVWVTGSGIETFVFEPGI